MNTGKDFKINNNNNDIKTQTIKLNQLPSTNHLQNTQSIKKDKVNNYVFS